MSFLNQLKSQASALQDQQRNQVQNFEASTAATENACNKAWAYLSDLARQLNVIEPPGPRFSLDGKVPWPTMKLVNFRADFRKKKLRDKEVFDYIAIGWEVIPQIGAPVGGSVSANFPPDLKRIETRLGAGNVKHERIEVRHPEKNTLLALRFDYLTEARGSVKVSADHENARLVFRVAGASGFEVIDTSWPAAQVQTSMLDELAKMMVAQPHTFA
jgi:hypothetical protein